MSEQEKPAEPRPPDFPPTFVFGPGKGPDDGLPTSLAYWGGRLAERLRRFLASDPFDRARAARCFRRFLACNPFYLLSAALLLYGFHCVSDDSGFLKAEQTQLVFNFTSLECYEALLVLTAIFLARRAIWYDSSLLVALENLFVFVPFILITQGALIDRRYLWIMCAAGGLLAVLRFGALKRCIAGNPFSNRLVALGLVLLAVNAALPVIYRALHESNRAGSNPDFGPQFEMSKYTWLLILPAAFALGNFLPRAREKGELLPSQRRWLPAGFFALWLAATAVHVYSMDYVYNLHIPTAWLAPVLWALAWTAWNRLGDWVNLPEKELKAVWSLAAILVPLLAAAEGRGIYLTLTALNAVFFACLWFARRDNRLARNLLFVSIFLLVAGLPAEWLKPIWPEFDRARFTGAGLAICFILWTALSRNPVLAVLGASGVFGVLMALLQGNAAAAHGAVQGALVFLLLHSLKWDDTRDNRTGRLLAALAWVIHAFIWMHFSDAPWLAAIPGGAVLGICIVVRLMRGNWSAVILPGAAALVMLSGPGNALVDAAHTMPGPVLVVMGSFVCFGFGTVAALTKHRWHPRQKH